MNLEIINKTINKIIYKYKNLQNSIKKIMNIGLIFCFILCIMSTIILFTYLFFSKPILFNVGISLFRSTLMFISMFFMCALGFDTVLNNFN